MWAIVEGLGQELLTAIGIACSASLYRVVYICARRRLGDDPAYISRCVSCVNAGVLVALAWQRGAIAPYWWPVAARAAPIGYLAHDAHLIWTTLCIWSKADLIHHGVFAALVYLAAGSYPGHTARAFLAELTVFPLFVGWCAFKGRIALSPNTMRLNAAVALTLFLRFRVYTFTTFIFEAINQQNWVLLPFIVSLAGLNWIWFFALLDKALATLL